MYSGPIPGKIWKHWKHFCKPLLTNHLPTCRNGNNLETPRTKRKHPTYPLTPTTTNATIAINFPTESKSVKRRSCQRPVSQRNPHGIGIDTCISYSGISDSGDADRNQYDEKIKTLSLLHDFEAQRPDGIRTRQPCL